MDTTHQKTAVLVRCMDKRHADNIVGALREKAGDYHFYELTEPGGAGLFADLQPKGTDWLLEKIKLTVDHLHAEEIFLAIHGASKEDPKGCGGYVLGGFADKYADADMSRDFSTRQLKKAIGFVNEKIPGIPVKAFYVTFHASGKNIVEEVFL